MGGTGRGGEESIFLSTNEDACVEEDWYFGKELSENDQGTGRSFA